MQAVWPPRSTPYPPRAASVSASIPASAAASSSVSRYRLHAGLPSTAARAQPPEAMGCSPGDSQTDQHQLSGGHARRLRALTQAAHLLAWKLETTGGVRRDARRSREAIADGRARLLGLSVRAANPVDRRRASS